MKNKSPSTPTGTCNTDIYKDTTSTKRTSLNEKSQLLELKALSFWDVNAIYVTPLEQNNRCCTIY